MTQTFLDLKPVCKRTFLVIVQEASREQIWQCSICKEWIEEEAHCGVCGRETCLKCDVNYYTPPNAGITATNLSLCSECSFLPQEVQDAAYQLRMALNA